MSGNWDEVGYVVSSTYRRSVMGVLAEHSATPSTIAEETDIAMAHVSTTLTDLRDRDLVTLLVPESRRKGRLYGLTEDGEDVWEVIEAEDL